MDEIEKLIEEQKKTQEAIKKLEEAGTLEKFLEKTEPAVIEYGDNEFMGKVIDPWDYDALETHRKDLIAQLIYQIYDGIGKLKYYTKYVDSLYKLRMEELTKDYEKITKQERKKLIRERYKNPVCREFFEKYEADHPIKRVKGRRKTDGKN